MILVEGNGLNQVERIESVWISIQHIHGKEDSMLTHNHAKLHFKYSEEARLIINIPQKRAHIPNDLIYIFTCIPL